MDTNDDFFDRRPVSAVLATRPINVVQASLLQIVTAVLTAVTTMNGYTHYVEMAAALGREAGSFEQFLLSRGASVVVSLLFAFLFYQGRNWARLFYIAFVSINAIFLLWSISVLGPKQVLTTLNSLDSAINCLQIVISLSICGLLMTKSSRIWFQTVKDARARERTQEDS